MRPAVAFNAMRWQVQDAKPRFSELIRTAHAEGPQVVTRHGEEIAVVVDIADYRRLKGEITEFKDYLRSGPGFDDLDLSRSKDDAQADLLEQWLRGLHATYRDHIINVDADVAEEWGRLNVPDPLPVIDGLLAASAKTRGWTLVTRSTADLARSGVLLLNPFDPPSPAS
jgi:prevent-host-death family protein